MENKTKDFYNNLQNENKTQGTEKKNVTKVEIKNEKKSLTIAVWLFLFVCLVMSIVSIVLFGGYLKDKNKNDNDFYDMMYGQMSRYNGQMYELYYDLSDMDEMLERYLKVENNMSYYIHYDWADIFLVNSESILNASIWVYKDYMLVRKDGKDLFIPIESVLYWEY